jgi:hypothetical protein
MRKDPYHVCSAVLEPAHIFKTRHLWLARLVARLWSIVVGQSELWDFSHGDCWEGVPYTRGIQKWLIE